MISPVLMGFHNLQLIGQASDIWARWQLVIETQLLCRARFPSSEFTMRLIVE